MAEVCASEPAVWWTFDLVREELVEVTRLWWRSPGSGSSPYAGDGPWELLLRDEAAGDYDARGGFDTSSDVVLRPRPLSREEVARRDAGSEWLRFIDKADDRRLVVLCCTFYASGYRQVPWRKVKRRMGVERGEAGLRKRFERAVSAVAQALNGAEIRR